MPIFFLNLAATVFGLLVHSAVAFLFSLLILIWFVPWLTLFGFTETTVLVAALPLVPIWVWFVSRYLFTAIWSVSWGFWAETFAGNEITMQDHLCLVRDSALKMWQDLVALKGKVFG